MPSQLSSRVARVEARMPARRHCPTCRDWRDFRVTTEPRDERHVDQSANPPEVCPSCGWRPDVLVVRCVDISPPRR